MFREPFVQVEEEKLLGPQHPGQRLSHYKGLVFADALRRDGSIELVGLTLTSLHGFSKALKRIAYSSRRQVTQPQSDRGGFACAHADLVMCGSFRSQVLW